MTKRVLTYREKNLVHRALVPFIEVVEEGTLHNWVDPQMTDDRAAAMLTEVTGVKGLNGAHVGSLRREIFGRLAHRVQPIKGGQEFRDALERIDRLERIVQRLCQELGLENL